MPARGNASHNGKTFATENANSKNATAKANASGKAKTNGKAAWQIIWIAVDHIAPNPFQPRLAFDELEMQELTNSVRAKGVQQPVIVRTVQNQTVRDQTVSTPTAKPKADKSATIKANSSKSGSTPLRSAAIRYELVAGERRLRACKAARKRWIPAIVRDDLTNAQAAELSLLENVQRSNISVIEEAKVYKQLMLEFRLKEERLSQKVGKSVAVIREMMKLLQLPEEVQTLLFQKKLTAAHGHALLPLAPFEKACLAVARYAAKEKLTAVSLQATLLPNVKELKSLGTLVELDYKTKFEWRSVCGKCPFKAYVQSNHSSYCLRPDEWEAKQMLALQQAEANKAEAAQVMAQARQDNSSIVDAEHLTPGSYKDLSFGDPPAGCSPACPCYREVRDASDPTKPRPVCLDPNRYRELVQAEREAEEKERQTHCNALWASAKDKLLKDVADGDIRRLTVLVVLPILRSLYNEYGYIQSWREGVKEIANELEVPLLEECVSSEDDGEAYAALDQALRQDVAPEKMFLLCADLLLAEEARQAIRFPRETPSLDYVLEAKQTHLETDNASGEDSSEGLSDDEELAERVLNERTPEETALDAETL
jgi:ParB/RepB/Spo0J family partition protein